MGGNPWAVSPITHHPLPITDRMVPAIQVEQISKSYGTLHALDRVSLTIERGEFFGLLGPNGAGKTTLIHILAGLTLATSGSARVMGHDVVSQYRDARRALGRHPSAGSLAADAQPARCWHRFVGAWITVSATLDENLSSSMPRPRSWDRPL